MEMDMPTSPSVADLPITDPRCVAAMESCTAFYAAENASQEATPFASLAKYGHWITYYYLAIIGVLMLLHFYNLWSDRKQPTARTVHGPTLKDRTWALGRYLFYRRFTLRPLHLFDLPSFGLLAFILATTVFLAALTFASRPYYRGHLGYGSPPIAIRTGLMAFACTPILIVLAGKANIVSLLTGISHERLNVLHRWVAWMSFVLSLIHTIPFFLASHWDGVFKEEFYRNAMRGTNEYSGVPPLGILFGLCVLSLPPLRDRFYETFYLSHILLAITYLGLLFWHAGNSLDSWTYLWSTLALWLASWCARAFWFTRPLNVRSTWFEGAQARMQTLSSDMTRIEVTLSTDFRYTPGQHVFLRFPAFAPLDNHPFTIASSPRRAIEERKNDSQHQLIFLIRTQAGFTRRLADYVASHSGTASAWIDGPYGGVQRPIEYLYDRIILLAGGTGISACIPWLLYLANSSGSAQTIRTKKVVLVWAIHDSAAFSWVSEMLESLPRKIGNWLELHIQFHVTGCSVSPSGIVSKEDAKNVKSMDIEAVSPDSDDQMTRMRDYGVVVQGRPKFSDILQQHVSEGRNLIIGCGPIGMRDDIANATAAAQSKVLEGGSIKEIAMHLEVFGW